ncbi:MAG TPA: AI-2E family transporter [Bryobacteraceae bacterium]|nr:AI-2E family transporter [Bryobacteraceae bacterium]
MLPATPISPAPTRSSASFRVLAFAAAVALLYYGRLFCISIVISLLIAFLLEPLVVVLSRFRFPRALASLVACTVALLVISSLGFAAYTEILGLVDDLPTYSERISTLVDNVATEAEHFETKTMEALIPKRLREAQPPPVAPPVTTRRRRKAEPAPPPAIQEVRLQKEPTPIFRYLYGYFTSIYPALFMASFVPFLVYFMLSWRDHLRRSFLYLFSGSDRRVIGKSWEGIAEIARAFLLGNFVLGVVISIVTCLYFLWIGMPYWLVVGVVSGFLSLVPYVGVLLAIAPPLVAGLAVYTHISSYVLIVVVVGAFHLIALNVLYPKIVGSRVHLNPLAVTIALMFWGTLWGGVGLLLAIPITAAVKAVCDNVPGIQGYGKLLGD